MWIEALIQKKNCLTIEVPLKCHWSSNNQQPTATATDVALLTPPLSTVGWFKTARYNNLEGEMCLFKRKIVSSKANIRTICPEDQRPKGEEVSDTHPDRRTWKRYDWHGPEGRVGINCCNKGLELWSFGQMSIHVRCSTIITCYL